MKTSLNSTDIVEFLKEQFPKATPELREPRPKLSKEAVWDNYQPMPLKKRKKLLAMKKR